MPTCGLRFAAIPTMLAAALLLAGAARGAGRPSVAALQVALAHRGLYAGTVDGVAGAETRRAVARFQRAARLPVDGIAGPRTRRALGRYGRHLLGSRPLARGATGWDVAALQFMLAWHGFPTGFMTGHFARHTARAVRRFERWAGLPVDGIAGPAVLRALHRPLPRSPLALAWPLRGPLGDGFGPRGSRFHAGVDVLAPTGAPVTAAARGRIVFAGYATGGWGFLVEIQHTSGVTTRYAHLSRILVRVGEWVPSGRRIGLVGATGRATGPHLHFEVRVRGAAVDPLPALR
jgi:peptidoglycan hydrolase-like protein with peptidoglycan-binding domain